MSESRYEPETCVCGRKFIQLQFEIFILDIGFNVVTSQELITCQVEELHWLRERDWQHLRLIGELDVHLILHNHLILEILDASHHLRLLHTSMFLDLNTQVLSLIEFRCHKRWVQVE